MGSETGRGGGRTDALGATWDGRGGTEWNEIRYKSRRRAVSVKGSRSTPLRQTRCREIAECGLTGACDPRTTHTRCDHLCAASDTG